MKVMIELNYYEETCYWAAHITFEKYSIDYSSENLSDLMNMIQDSVLIHKNMKIWK